MKTSETEKVKAQVKFSVAMNLLPFGLCTLSWFFWDD